MSTVNTAGAGRGRHRPGDSSDEAGAACGTTDDPGIRGQPQQPGAAHRARLWHAAAAGPVGDRGGPRLRLRVGRRQPVLQAPLRVDGPPVGASPSAPSGSSWARPASSPRPATRCTSRSNGRRWTTSRTAGPSSAPAPATPRRASAASSRRSAWTSTAASHLRGGPRGRARAVDRRARSPTTGAVRLPVRRSRFYSGTEMGPLMPIQQPPPFWIVSNPRLVTDAADEKMVRTMKTACRRILKYGDGWMTCCRAQHPEELVEQLGYLREVAAETDDDASRLRVSYQVTLNIGDSEDGGPPGLRRLHRPVLPRAVQGHGPGQLGPGRHPGADHRVVPDVRGGGRRPFHLPLRLARPVRAGGAVRPRGAARAPRAERRVARRREVRHDADRGQDPRARGAHRRHLLHGRAGGRRDDHHGRRPRPPRARRGRGRRGAGRAGP